MTMHRLREATADLHALVEVALDPNTRFASQSSYVELLQVLHPFYVTIETKLTALPWNSIGFDFNARRKATLLEADLRALGEVDHEPMQSEVSYPVLIDLASGFGALYVLEGATLGGRILRKVLRSRLDIDHAGGGSFYAGYGDATQDKWREFGTALNGYCDRSEQRRDSAVAAATATFTAIGRILTAPHPFPPPTPARATRGSG